MKNIPVVSCVSFKLKIPAISKVKEICSPEFTVCGLPWQFKIVKTYSDNNHLLSIYLQCMKEHDKEAVWSCAAIGSFKLLTLDNSRTEIEEHIGPFVFDQRERGFGRTTAIAWRDVLNSHRNAMDDTANFELKIDVADPTDSNISRIIFARHYNTKFRLMVTNINNLMAARSSPFIFQKMQFNLVVYKSFCSHLGVYLHKRGNKSDKPLRLRMSAKLLAPKDGSGIEKIHTNTLDKNTLKIEQLISWDALFDWRSGFVDNNNIIMEVELSVC
ncbi:uncharacterized protein LOC119071946 [Bradysia coprophila]|uniref:uncharacterized protein LOC119071946 n=1 Tax=Bradysia coprophila TaxID=38358 RepID=UPI00187DB1B7|nr:uncharacterized protein LOC119071946 [Bradysia coprophila]